ncbi:MAG: Ig-like domain-containing protein [Candidatus Staskawiczbacteria bacterium]|jgi:uncharacterized protein YjdB
MTSEKNKKIDTNINLSSDEIVIPDELVQAYKYKKEKKQHNRTLFSTFSLSLVAFLVAGVFVFLPEIPKDKVASSTTIPQEQVVAGQQVKYTTLVAKSEVINGKYLAKLPQNAKNIKVSTINNNTANQILSSKPNKILSLAQRQQLAILPTNNNNQIFSASLSPSFKFLSGFLNNVYKYLSADLSEAIENATEVVTNNSETQEITQTPEATYVDISLEATTIAPEIETTPIVEAILEQNSSEQETEAPVLEEATTQELIMPEIPEQMLAQVPAEEVQAEEPISSETSVGTSTETPIEAPAEELAITPVVENVPEEFVAIEYTTVATEIVAEVTDSGQQVTVSSVEENPAAPITDVLASTKIPEIFKVGQENRIQIQWENESNQQVAFHAYDTDNNGKLDYVEWTVPHLSTQVFNIIFISQAFHLDEQQNILADIYDTVRFQDNNYTTITNNQYVRVTFDGILDNTNDNTIHAKATDPNNPARIEVYPAYTDENGNVTHGPLVATFENIAEAKTHKVLLTNLQTPTDLFDLKIIGSVDIDYIVDPVYTSGLVSVSLNSAGYGYYSVGQVISVPGGNSDGSISVAEISGGTGSISSVSLNSGGYGFQENDSLTVQGGNYDGYVTVTSVDGPYGVVYDASTYMAGSGYTEGNEVTISSGDYNATIYISGVGSSGEVTSFSVSYGGTNYSSNSFVGTSGGSGSGFEVSISAGQGTVTGISLSSGGSNYGTGSNSATGGSGSDCSINIDSIAGTISSISISAPGTGYSVTSGVSLDMNGLAIDITAVDAEPLYTWVGSYSTDWNDSSNWQDYVVPPEGTSVQIVDSAMNSPVIPSGTSVTILNLTISSSSGYYLINQGTIVDITGTISFTGSASQAILNQGLITNISGTFDNSSGNIGIYNDTSGIITDITGTITNSGAGNIISNYGTITDISGALTISGGGNGIVNNVYAIITDISGTVINSNGGISNYGTITDISGTFTNTSVVGITNNANAVITDISGTFTNNANNYGIYNLGTITNISGAVENTDASGYGIVNNDGATISNISGTVTNSGAGYGVYNSGTITVTNTATINNTSSGVGFVVYDGVVNGAGTITGNITVEAAGTLNLNAGLTIVGTITNNSGTVTPVTSFDCTSINKVLGADNLSNAMCVLPLTTSVGTCGTITSSGTYTLTTDLSVSSGNCIVISASNVTLSGGSSYSINVSGSGRGVYVSGSVTGVTIASITINSSGDTSYGVFNGGTITNISGTINNSDNGSGIYNGGAITDISGTVANTLTGYGIDNHGSIANITGTLTNTGDGWGIDNSGDIYAGNYVVSAINQIVGTIYGGTYTSTVDNYGTIDMTGSAYGPPDFTGATVTDYSGTYLCSEGYTWDTNQCVEIPPAPPAANGEACTVGGDCSSAFCTSNGYCSDMSAGSVCAINDDCDFGLECADGVCAEIAPEDTLVSSITVSGAESATTVVNGSTLQMSVSILPVDATDQTVTWSKTDGTGTATINSSGLLTATGVGAVTVRATANDGSNVYGELEITVTTLNISVTGVTLDDSTASILVDATHQLTSTVAPDNATDSSVTWSSSNTSVATVSDTGLVTAISAGTATITVTTTDGDHTATATITVPTVGGGGGGSYTATSIVPLAIDAIQTTSQSIMIYMGQALDEIRKSIGLLRLNFITPAQPTTGPDNLQPNTLPLNQTPTSTPTSEENRSAVINIYEKIINTLISILGMYIGGESAQ